MGSQRIARPSLERGMEAASGKKRTPQHEGVTEGRGGNGRKPPPPHTMCQKSQGLVTIHPDLNFPPRNILSKIIASKHGAF